MERQRRSVDKHKLACCSGRLFNQQSSTDQSQNTLFYGSISLSQQVQNTHLFNQNEIFTDLYIL